MQTTIPLSMSSAAAMLLLSLGQTTRAADDTWTPLGPDNNFAAWHQPTGDWYVGGRRHAQSRPEPAPCRQAGHRRHDQRQDRQNAKPCHQAGLSGRRGALGVHGGQGLQLGRHLPRQPRNPDPRQRPCREPTGAHCGGVYPRAEGEPGTPTYRHIDKGSPPRVNAAKPPGQWQTLDIIFQAARFDENGNKTAHARFVKVVHNGMVIQEDVEMPYAHGPNWDRKQYPRGPIIFQGDYGPIAFRNIRVRPWKRR